MLFLERFHCNIFFTFTQIIEFAEIDIQNNYGSATVEILSTVEMLSSSGKQCIIAMGKDNFETL